MTSTKTMAAANGYWEQILTSFGIDAKILDGTHRPCPVCGGDDRFRFDNKKGNGTFYCSHCDPSAGDGMNLLMNFKGWDFQTAANEVDKVVGNCTEKEVPKETGLDQSKKYVDQILEGCVPIEAGGIVKQYFNNRGLFKIPRKHLLFNPRVYHYEKETKESSYHPAMVTKIQAPDGSLDGIHINYLTEQGHKASVRPNKKIMRYKDKAKGGAVRLTDMRETIGIAEGIETAIAVMNMYQVPCWATCNANKLEEFFPPEGVREVYIFADNDLSFTGQKAAFNLAYKLKRHKRQFHVRCVVAPSAGTDFADMVGNR